MNFIKIDSWTRTVAVAAVDGSNNSFCNLIGCQFLDVSARWDDHEAVRIDDDALSADLQPPAFTFDGFGPIHGIAIVARSDWDGKTTEPAFMVDEVTQHVDWLGNVYTQPAILVSTW